MEVLFAIGVLTIGLMGVAFILPVATNNAAMALQDDRAAEEVNNRVASDLARLSQEVNYLIQPENAQTTQAHFNTPGSFNFPSELEDVGFQPGGAGLPGSLSRYGRRSFDELPDAFCLDPWFLTSANNLRVNGNANSYDRTYFPCYDPTFVPTLSPSTAITASHAVTWTWPAYSWTNPASGAVVAIPARTLNWNSPRFVRMALPRINTNITPSYVSSRQYTTSDDDLSVVTADDSTIGAGLFVQRSTNAMRSLSKSNVTGRYSSMVMMSRSEPGSSLYNAAVVTFKDRQVVTVPGGEILGNGDDLKFQLQPYTAAGPGTPNPTDPELTYPSEVMGYVISAQNVMRGGGGGEFIFRTSAATYPNVREGGWVCLMRQEYRRDPNPYVIADTIPPKRITKLTPPDRRNAFDSEPEAPLHFGWYRISDVVAGPTLDTSTTPATYITQLQVRGPDWVFHPSQVTPTGVGYGFYGTPYRFSGPTPSATAFLDNPDFGTICVVMPEVISVKQFPFQFQ